MKKHNQDGAANVLLLPLVVASILFIGSLAFGYWAFSGRQDYKNNVDQKISVAVTAAKQQESATKDAAFAEASKDPLKTYSGPEADGSVVVRYPKTWSAYVDTTGTDTLLDGYFHPDTIPSITDQGSNFALRVQVLDQSYSTTVSNFQSSTAGSTGFTVAPYALPKVPKAVGVRVEGQIQSGHNGSMVILPLRNSTLEIYTEATQYENDFNNNILPNFTFSP